MKRKLKIAGACILAGGLWLALGAAAHRIDPGLAQAGQKPPAGTMGRGMMGSQMGQGHMGQGMMGEGQKGQGMKAAQEKARKLVGDLLANQAAMDKAKSRAALRPLLERNGDLLRQLRAELDRSWGMHRRMGSGMSQPAATPPSRTRSRAAAAAPASPASKRLIAEGKEVFAKNGCRVCHGEGGIGTPAGTRLVGVGKKYSTAKIAALIRKPASSRMPTYSSSALPEAKLKEVVAYLESLR